jgi:pyridoxal phosphate enzyme (YggS family)
MDSLAEKIRQNFQKVSENIQHAARSTQHSSKAVQLVVVTKAQPVEVIRAAVNAGARILGENYPEETLPKIQALGWPAGAVEWHMIGHLQSRKAGIVAEQFDMLQSLDSLTLAEKLEKQLAERNRVLPVLLEANVSGEESKFGWPAWEEDHWNRLLAEMEAILALPHLTVRGLMTMPPLYDDPERSRPFFVRLRRLGEFLAGRFGEERFSELSMGTSSDYQAAVQEGATLVRIGTAIVGPRPKKR